MTFGHYLNLIGMHLIPHFGVDHIDITVEYIDVPVISQSFCRVSDLYLTEYRLKNVLYQKTRVYQENRSISQKPYILNNKNVGRSTL